MISCKKILVTVVLASLSISAFAQPAPKQIFQLPEYKRVQLPNGMTLLLLEKHSLPLVSVQVALRSGSIADPAGKEGTASITAALLRKGTNTRSAEQVSADLDFIGMQYGAEADQDGSYVSADFLKKDLDKAMDLLSDLMLHATFPVEEVRKKTAQEQDAVRSAKDDPDGVYESYFLKFLYGDHPYGRPPGGDEQSLGNITRDDIAAFYKRNYTPGNTIVAVVGDFDSAAMQAKLSQLFGSWKGAAPAAVNLPALKPVTGKRVLLVDKPDSTQTYIVVGNIGLAATNPDRGSVDLVNTLFGGRYTSTFNTELRIKSGFSYSAFSYFDRYRVPGPFIMYTYTRNATTEPAIDKSLEVLGTLHKQGYNAEDIASGKNYVNGTFPLRMETTAQLAGRMVRLEMYGITRDQFNQSMAQEEATTAADAKRVTEIYFPSQDYVMVLIGKASEIQKIAAKYAPKVATKKISDPGF
jgi:zinc protease